MFNPSLLLDTSKVSSDNCKNRAEFRVLVNKDTKPFDVAQRGVLREQRFGVCSQGRAHRRNQFSMLKSNASNVLSYKCLVDEAAYKS